MIQLTAMQKSIMDVIAAHDGIKYGDMMEKSGILLSNGTGTIQSLLNKKLIIRKGKQRRFFYHWTGIPYGALPEGDQVYIELPASPDPFLKRSASIQLTSEQRFYLDNHKHLPRTQLARKLGISKLELNFAMDSKRK
ncbi:hypothetical protein [Bacillus sp. FJAT-26390]|uniref:hypothetical protein n=1 Tax=Bacillus sp. FJAT-26390 TaxID=1743142 RepID=UPI000807F0BF|nr:hypothetical protein [Bacillus sp. FJAT-26390]OBZ15143.1 hypothetical protein A7975_32560 [Bacillus sp. FJAT-26390]